MHGSGHSGRATRGIDPDRIAYTIAETARLLGISDTTVYQLIKSGELPSFKIGAARRVHGSAIEEFIRRNTEKETQERVS
jgi:excisionase family DNA binding protein